MGARSREECLRGAALVLVDAAIRIEEERLIEEARTARADAGERSAA
jgi:hypothetical protein